MNVVPGDFVELDWNVSSVGSTGGASVRGLVVDGNTSQSDQATIDFVKFDSLDNIYVLGKYIGTVNIGGVTMTNISSSYIAFVAKFTPTFSLVWVKQVRVTLTADPTSTTAPVNTMGLVLVQGNVFALFSWAGYINLAVGEAASRIAYTAGHGLIVATYDSVAGNYVDHLQFKSTGQFDAVHGSIAVSQDNSLWATGGCALYTGFSGACGSSPLNVAFVDRSVSTASGAGVDTWDWDFGDGTAHGTTQNPTHNYTSPGVYTVVLTATRSTGFVATRIKTSTVRVVSSGTAPGVVADFVFSPKATPLQSPVVISFFDTSEGKPTTWDWDFGDGTGHSNLQNPTHNYTAVGRYVVTLTVGGATHSETVDIGQPDQFGHPNNLVAEFDIIPYQFQNTTPRLGMFVAKINPLTNRPSLAPLLFSSTVGSWGTAIGCDSNTNEAIATGTFGGTVDFSGGQGTGNLTAQGPNDMVVAKYKATGAFSWAFGYTSTVELSSTCLTVDSSGNIAVGGEFKGISSYGGNGPPISTTSTDIGYYPLPFFSLYGPTGSVIGAVALASAIGGPAGPVFGIVLGLSNVYVCGPTGCDLGFPAAAGTNAGGTVAWVACYSFGATPTYKWGYTILEGNAGFPNVYNEGNCLAMTSDQSLLAFGGYFIGTKNFKGAVGNLVDRNPQNPGGFLVTLTP